MERQKRDMLLSRYLLQQISQLAGKSSYMTMIPWHKYCPHLSKPYLESYASTELNMSKASRDARFAEVPVNATIRYLHTSASNFLTVYPLSLSVLCIPQAGKAKYEV